MISINMCGNLYWVPLCREVTILSKNETATDLDLSVPSPSYPRCNPL